jgi:uncharacterized membrane protein
MSPMRLDRDPARVLSPQRAVLAVSVGLAVGVAVALAGEPALLPIVGWVVATSVALLWVWRLIWPLDEQGTKRLAEAESRSRTTDTAVLAAAVASLGAVVLAVVRSNGDTGVARGASVILSVVAVVLSWALVNTVFALKYARLYYLDEDGGIDFHQEEPPAYSDFAYLAFTVGMAFAVPDTEPTTSRIRRAVLGHAILSYVLGTGILAVGINLVTNLGQS